MRQYHEPFQDHIATFMDMEASMTEPDIAAYEAGQNDTDHDIEIVENGQSITDLEIEQVETGLALTDAEIAIEELKAAAGV